MERPILNPPNPYVGTLRIFPGTLVKISGRPRPNATRFAINFQTGPSLNPRDDLALHLSPCFTPPRVIRNSLINGVWGLEEAWGNGTMVNPHQPVEFMILAERDQFKIAINGAHYCEFKHRIPHHEITHLTIDGDVDIERITISDSSYSSSQPAYNQPSAPPTSTAASNPPYPTGPIGMPMPPMYPSLPSGPPQAAGPYPVPTSMPYPPSGPTPQPASYMPGYPQASGGPSYYPSGSGGPNPTGASYSSGAMSGPAYHGGPNPAGYPSGPVPTGSSGYPGGPNPTGAHYQGGYPPQQQPHGHQSSPFGSLPIGGKALGTLAGVLKEGVYRKFPLARHFL